MKLKTIAFIVWTFLCHQMIFLPLFEIRFKYFNILGQLPKGTIFKFYVNIFLRICTTKEKNAEHFVRLRQSACQDH